MTQYTAHNNAVKTSRVGRGWTTDPNTKVKSSSFGLGCLIPTAGIIAVAVFAMTHTALIASLIH